MLRRFLGWRRDHGGIETVQLPWKLPLEVNTGEAIGRTISHHGLFEMSVVEAIFRLTSPDDVFLDVGANIGFMSSVALAAGAKSVFAFEPNPSVFRQLQRNASLWAEAHPRIATRVTVRHEAISDKAGTASLSFPKHGFSGNHGIASLERGDESEEYVCVDVATETLNQVCERCGCPIGVLKIDIEGHELTALSACEAMLQSGTVRDIIYEDHDGLSSKVSRLLANAGYSLFEINKKLFGPVLIEEAEVGRAARLSDESINFMATREPQRARKCFSSRGFECLSAKPAY
jgi:FkbM family methyltransferase